MSGWRVTTSGGRPALFRLGGGDAEAAHEWTLRRLAGLPPAPGGRWPRCCGGARRRAARRVRGALPQPGRAGRRDGQERPWRCRPGRRSASASSRSARSPRTPQPGNARPRLFRLPASEAVINRMGFNNAGRRARWPRRLAARCPRPAAGRAAGHLPGQVQGDAAGRTRSTTTWPRCGRCVTDGDYFAVNVSSPNTPGLRVAAGPGAPRRAARRAGRGTQAGAGEDRAGPHRRGDRRAAGGLPRARRGRGDRHQHHARPGRPGRRGRRAGARPAGCPAGR